MYGIYIIKLNIREFRDIWIKKLKQKIKEDKENILWKKYIFNLIKRIVGDKFQKIGKQLIIIYRKYWYYKIKLNKNFLDKIFCVIYKYKK